MPDIRTNARGLKIIPFGFRHKASDDPDFLWQANAGDVTSVVKDATTGGTYTVQLEYPYPRQIVAALPALHSATADTGEIASVRVDLDSYDPATGTFDIEVYTDDGDGTLTIEQPIDNTAITVVLFCQMVEALATQTAEAHA